MDTNGDEALPIDDTCNNYFCIILFSFKIEIVLNMV